ncbi:MAG: cation:proton antiporter [Acidobacteriota bacterium]
MESMAFAAVATAILGFGLISGRVQNTIITAPLVFVGFGMLLGEHGLGLFTLHVEDHVIHTLAELTLVLVLFTDATRINLEQLRRQHNLPIRLLAIGMPLTIVLGTLVAIWLFPELTFWEAALLAAVLAPTDAALGQAVVSSPKVPVRIRQTLNVESGLNDGIALPLVLVFLSTCSSAVPGQGGTEYWLKFAALQVTLGPLIGIAVGLLGSRLVSWGMRSKWMNEAFQHLSTLGLALLSFAGAELIGGNGFIAAFCAGITLGNTSSCAFESLYEFAEAEGQLLALLVFLVFGAVLLPGAIDHVTWQYVLYGVLSLTVVRMVPVAISLIGARLRKETVLFLGWFGPRGIASVLFGLVVVESSVLHHREEIFFVMIITVALSVIAHGVSAFPGVEWYSAHSETYDATSGEHQDVAEMPVRIRHA